MIFGSFKVQPSLTETKANKMETCKRIQSGEFAEYHYKGHFIVKCGDHWNVGLIGTFDAFDSADTKKECKLIIDRYAN